MTTHRFRFESASGDLLGAHLSTKGGVHSIFDRAKAISASAAALFSKNANQWNAKPLSDEDCERFAIARAEANLQPIVTHAAYLINLCTTNEEFHRKSIAAMIDELERAERLGIHAVVLHPGAHMGAGMRDGIDKIARSLDAIHAALPDHNVVTLLETAAGQGSCVGGAFEELGSILKLVDDTSRVGVCFDTCHVFSAGYDIRNRDGYETTIEELDRHVGLENVGAFHLNDSKKGLGSRVDRHQHIGDGEIGLDAFAFLLNDARFRGIPKVLETPKKNGETADDIRNLTTLRSLIGAPPARRLARRQPAAAVAG